MHTESGAEGEEERISGRFPAQQGAQYQDSEIITMSQNQELAL